MALSAREILLRVYGNSRNFMTPKVLATGKISPRMAYELSTGEGISGEPIFGVSIVTVDDAGKTRRETELSDCFPTRELAVRHIEKLREQEKIQCK